MSNNITVNNDIKTNKKDKKKRKLLGSLINAMLILCIVFLAALLIFLNVFSLCPVRQESMHPTVLDGERVLLLKTKNIKNGDIFVFKTKLKDSETGENKNLIKRVIASGGDRLLFVVSDIRPSGWLDDRIVYLYRDTGNGFVLLDESKYIAESMLSHYTVRSEFCKILQLPNPDKLVEDIFKQENEELINLIDEYIIKVPKGYYYAMGDNRNVSGDSRAADLGFIKKKDIIGRLTLKLKKDSVLEKLLRFLYRD